MSHFPAYVLVPENTEDVGLKLIELLAPYDEGLEIELYEAQCECVRYAAADKARELCFLRYGPSDTEKEQLEKLMAEKPDADEDVEWARLMKERDELAETEFKKLLPTISPDPDCEQCGGKGVVISRYNENAKWDWWEIGGRWDDMLGGSWQNVSHADHNGQVASLRELALDRLPTPFAIVTPEGEWHAQGDMGSFARIIKLDEEWDSKARELILQNQDCIVVVVDCHAA
jgi:hypothetical protein